ncbi:MAG: hypothetical protein AAF519_17415, partial [Bacteroidota bacterium]
RGVLTSEELIARIHQAQKDFDDFTGLSTIVTLPGGGMVMKGGLKLAARVLQIRRVATRASNFLKFGGDEAVVHFGKHADQIMKITGKTAYNLKNYVDDANWIIRNGTYSSKLNGYYHYMGNAAKGESLFGFVGLKNGGSTISTFHIKTATQLGLR